METSVEQQDSWVQFSPSPFDRRTFSSVAMKKKKTTSIMTRNNATSNNLYSKRIPLSPRIPSTTKSKSPTTTNNKKNGILISPVNMNSKSYQQTTAAVECIYGSPPPSTARATATIVTTPSHLSTSLSYTPSPSPRPSSYNDNAYNYTAATPQQEQEQEQEQEQYVENKSTRTRTAIKETGIDRLKTKSTSRSWDRSTESVSLEDGDGDTAEGYVAASPRKDTNNRKRRCICFVLVGLVCLFVLFLLSLMIGAGLRGDAISWNNLFFGEEELTPSPSVSMSPSTIPSISPTWSPSSHYPTFLGIPPSNITVGAYYYPWHGNNFHGAKYLRKHLNQEPALGEYDDTKWDVVAQHLAWSRQANIRLWITTWWGPDRREDTTTKNVILTHRHLEDHQIALFYETTGRIKKAENYTTQRIISDIDYICLTYFDHPNYYRVDGRPVLFIYLTRKLETVGVMEEVILLMRSTADYHGYDIFMIGDHVWETAPSSSNLNSNTNQVFRPFLYLDAMTNYDVYGSMTGKEGMYAGQEAVSKYYSNQRQWKIEANQKKCGYIPAVSPGFNDRGVRLDADHRPLSRKLTQDDQFGSLFKAQLDRAKYLVDDTMDNLLIVNSFNEWHEDTQIEPAIDNNNGINSSQQYPYTQGVEYQGYGDLYLNLLREATKDPDDDDDDTFILTALPLQNDTTTTTTIEETINNNF